jgi:hypothetical protein
MAAAGCWVGLVSAQAPLSAQEVRAEAPSDLSVTVYRAPYRRSGSIDLDSLEGFALIRETRTVNLPAGLSRVRFEGVADGMEAVSAILVGLTDGVIEKNLDAQLLSPATLIAAAVGRRVTLLRTNAKTGQTERVSGVIRAAADGVVFETQDGIEALRCSNLPESFTFTNTTGLTASPTLSVLIRTTRRVTERIQLSYLAHGFDWAANYSATLSADDKTVDLGAWVTLANGNGVGLPAAHTQVVAGRLNHQSGVVEPIDAGGAVLARCWPQGSTSDEPQVLQIERAIPLDFQLQMQAGMSFATAALASPMARGLAEVTVTGSRVSQEQLGDLKLYRVPQRTTVASRQAKQVRLLDRQAIPVHRAYTTDLYVNGNAHGEDAPLPVAAVLRTRNDASNHLGLPLPSGQVAVFASRGNASLLLNEAGIRDLALNEEVEFDLGTASDVQARSIGTQTTIDPAQAKTIPLVPGVLSLREAQLDVAQRVEVANARASSIDFELRLQLQEGRVVRADQPLGTRNGRPVFRLHIPAHTTMTVRFQTAHVQVRAVRPPN